MDQDSNLEYAPKSTNGRRCIEIVLVGHLQRAGLDEILRPAAEEIRESPDLVNLLVDCRRMVDYDAEARLRFLEWNRDYRKRVYRVAVVTEKAMWHMVVGAMAIASGQHIKAFDDVLSARGWLAQLVHT